MLTDCKSYKSLLQERAQKNSYLIPEYLVEQYTDSYTKDIVFAAKVMITDSVFGSWTGNNKKKAHEEAAKDAYIKITAS